MKRKIGEIFEYNGEWYQCVKSDGTCNGCVGKFQPYSFCNGSKGCVGKIFKKLEKVGEPYSDYCPSGRVIYFQKYKCYQKPIYTGDIVYWADDIHISLEIKQNKEDMEEKKIQHYDCFFDKKKSNLKPFDIQKAREGKPVYTRDGRKARIICFDAKSSKPIIALVDVNGTECIMPYFIDGRFLDKDKRNDDSDLMMLKEKHEGWVNIYKSKYNHTRYVGGIYKTKKEALKGADYTVVATVKIEWEE